MTQLKLEISDSPALSAESREELARLLLDEVSQIPGIAASLANAGPAPDGAKGLGGSLAEVVIALGAAGALLPTIVTTTKEWLLRQPPATAIKLKDGEFEFEISGNLTKEELAGLIGQLQQRRKD